MATPALTDEEVRRFEYGSKIQLTAWYSYTALLWALKGTMLCFFKRMTTGLWQTRLVKWIGIACIISYIAVVCTVRKSYARRRRRQPCLEVLTY
jgi:hypothetical protein